MTPEGSVLRACLDLLAAERIWHCRMNTGALKVDKRFFRFGKKGMADILSTPWIFERCDDSWSIRPLWIEAKAAKGRQTEDQAEFEREVSEQGHHYLLVRDVDTLKSWLIEHGVIRSK